MALAVVVDLALVVVAVGGLWLGATWFVTGADRVARRVGLSGLVVGLTVVAFGTSAPEFAVTVDAAVTGRSDISVGNVVGSNVFNLGVVLGAVALVRALPVSSALLRRDGLVLVGTTVLLFVVLWDRLVSRPEGVVLVVLLGAYLLLLVRTDDEQPGGDREPRASFRPFDIGRVFGGLAVVVAGAHVLVVAASDLAGAAGVSEWVIGVTVVAAGTSTPEFVTSVTAARRGQAGISAGNLVGSCIFNALGVLGVAALIRPLPVAGAALRDAGWLLGIVIVVTALFWSGRLLSRLEGGLLVALNAANWVTDWLL